MARGQRRGPKSGPFSARFDTTLLERLRRRSEQTGQPGSRIAERLIDEGLRMDEFPGMVFRSGPTGRRAGLVGGPDIWEVIGTLRQVAPTEADPIAAVAEYLSLPEARVRVAAAYYDAFPEEIDERIRLNDEMAERIQRTLEGRLAAR